MVQTSALFRRVSVRVVLALKVQVCVTSTDSRLRRMLCWWGIWILCLSPTTKGDLSSSARAAQYGAVVSPLFTFMCVSRCIHSLYRPRDRIAYSRSLYSPLIITGLPSRRL